MKVQVTARLDGDLVRFLEAYQRDHDRASRSEALEDAIVALRDRVLEHEYSRAMDEWLVSDDLPVGPLCRAARSRGYQASGTEILLPSASSRVFVLREPNVLHAFARATCRRAHPMPPRACFHAPR